MKLKRVSENRQYKQSWLAGASHSDFYNIIQIRFICHKRENEQHQAKHDMAGTERQQAALTS